MKMLVTGATGFIGSRLALEAQKLGHEIVASGQLNSDAERTRARELQGAGIGIQQAPLQNLEHARQLASGCHTVIHLAAAQHEANVSDDYFFDVNVNATQALLEAGKSGGVQRFVYGSTIGIYGESAGQVLDENTQPKPANVYGRSKLKAEEVVNSYRSALPVSIVRISETYGPGDFRLLKLFRAVDRRRFVIIGSGLNQRQVIHVSDLARGLLLAASSPAAVGETFVMAGNEVLTTRDMVQQVAGALGRAAPRGAVPMWPFLATATVMERTLRPLGIQPPLHRRRLDFFRKSFVFSTDKARSLLGFTPHITFGTGAAETADWYRRGGYL